MGAAIEVGLSPSQRRRLTPAPSGPLHRAARPTIRPSSPSTATAPPPGTRAPPGTVRVNGSRPRLRHPPASAVSSSPQAGTTSPVVGKTSSQATRTFAAWCWRSTVSPCAPSRWPQTIARLPSSASTSSAQPCASSPQTPGPALDGPTSVSRKSPSGCPPAICNRSVRQLQPRVEVDIGCRPVRVSAPAPRLLPLRTAPNGDGPEGGLPLRSPPARPSTRLSIPQLLRQRPSTQR